MNLSFFRIILFSLIGFISLTSSTVPASRTPKVKKTTKNKLAQKDKRIFKLKEKTNKQKKAKRQKTNKSIRTWSWLSLLLGILAAGMGILSLVIGLGIFSYNYGLVILTLVISMILSAVGLLAGIMNFIQKDKLSIGDWILTILGLIINLAVLLIWTIILLTP